MMYHAYIIAKHLTRQPLPKMRQHGDCVSLHFCPKDGKLCAMHPYINLHNAVNYFCDRCSRVCDGEKSFLCSPKQLEE